MALVAHGVGQEVVFSEAVEADLVVAGGTDLEDVLVVYLPLAEAAVDEFVLAAEIGVYP